MLKAVIFDMDGVLLDSEVAHYKVLKKMFLEEYDYDFPLEDFVSNCGTPEDETWVVQLGRAGIDADRFALKKRHWELYEEYKAEHGLPTFPGLKEFLISLKERGCLLAVASSSAKEEIRTNLKYLDCERYFDEVVSAQECKKGKPNPEVFLLAASMLGVQPESCLVIEDSYSGMVAAKRAGMKWIGFCGSEIPTNMSYADITFSDYRIVDSSDMDKWFSVLEQ